MLIRKRNIYWTQILKTGIKINLKANSPLGRIKSIINQKKMTGKL